MENLDTKGKRLSYLINSKIINLSKSQLADLIGISPTLLSFYINDGRNIKDEHLKEIYKHFPKVNAEWLEQGKEPVLRQISNSQNGSLFGFEDENYSNADIYTVKNDVKLTHEILQDRKNEQEPSKNVEKIIEVVERVVEKTIDKKIMRITVYYEDGTFKELFAE